MIIAFLLIFCPLTEEIQLKSFFFCTEKYDRREKFQFNFVSMHTQTHTHAQIHICSYIKASSRPLFLYRLNRRMLSLLTQSQTSKLVNWTGKHAEIALMHTNKYSTVSMQQIEYSKMHGNHYPGVIRWEPRTHTSLKHVNWIYRLSTEISSS